MVKVDVRFNGEPLSVSAKSMEFITAHGTGFGQSDGFFLMSYIMGGKAEQVYHSASMTFNVK